MRAVSKARAWSDRIGSAASRAAQAYGVFSPPPGGASYYSTQGYRWQQVVEGYRHWSFIAISCYIREIAGGEPPVCGRMVHHSQSSAKSKAWSRRKWIKKALGIQEGFEFEAYQPDDPILRVFENPNKPDVAYDLWAYTVLFHMLCGYVVLWIRRNEWGIPTEIWPIPTHWIQQLSTDHSMGEYVPNGFVVMNPWGQQHVFPFDECVVLQDHSPLSRWEGYAVSIAIGEWLDTYESLVRTRLAQFKNGAVPNIHVALGENYADPDEAFLARFYAKWYHRFQGENRAGLPLITDAGTEVKVLGTIPIDLFRDGDEAIATHVLAAYGVPKGVAGVEPAGDTSAYAPLAQFCRFRVNPLLNYYGQRMTEKIIRKSGKGYRDGVLFWHDRVPNDPEQVNRDINTDLSAGAITPNEVRDIRGRERYAHGGNDPLIDARSLVNWGTGKKPEQDSVMDMEIERQLSESAGGAGGFLTEPMRRTVIAEASRGRQLAKHLQRPGYQRILNGAH